MSKRKLVCYVVFGATALTMAGVGAYAKRATSVAAAEAAALDTIDGPQIANRAAKGARLPAQAALMAPAPTAPEQPAYQLASLDPNATLARPLEPTSPAVAPPQPEETAAPPRSAAPQAAAPQPPAAPAAETKPARPAVAAVTPPPEHHDKPKRPAAASLFDEGQIAGLKGRLHLTPEQMEYWPAVEAALRDVVRSQLHAPRHGRGGKPNIDVNSPEVQKLIWAAMPLLMRLREDQKGEVRKLARVIGLEQVASQI